MSDPKDKNPFAALASLAASVPEGPKRTATPVTEAPRTNPLAKKKLVVSRSRKGRGGKTVTMIAGLVGSTTELEELAKGLRTALGCGASVEDGQVVVAGDQCDRVKTWLEARGATHVIIGN